jgi:hypothetical protein
MADLLDLPNPKCLMCGKRASVQLINRHNGSHGEFCRRCGATRLKTLQASEAAVVQGAMKTQSQEGDEVR